MNKQKSLQKQRTSRRFRVRNTLRGNGSRPRLTVFRSNKHVACQLIDDQAGRTLAAASSRDGELRDQSGGGGNREAAARVGQAIAARALAAGVSEVYLDRGHYKYHGRVAALADAAREAGLKL